MDKVDCYVVPQTSGTGRNIFQGGNPLSSSLPLLGVQLALIVAFTRVLYVLLKPLKQPRVVSEIMGGIILGPSLLCRNEAFKQQVFPARGEPVLNTIATFGLMYVIFLIGVRMDPRLAVRSGKKGVVIGLSGFLIPLALTASFSSGEGLEVEEDMSKRSTFLFALTASLSVTSFAVLSPILSELNLLNSDLGRIAMSASMTTDGIAWLIMVGYVLVEAFLVSPATSLWAFLSVAALVGFILLVVRPIALLVIERTPAGSPVDETYVFFFLLIVLLVGLYSDCIGTNSFHGALMLGLAIPDGPPLGTALGEKIEAMVSGIILPLYYAMTGLSTDMWEIHWGRLQLVLFLGWLGKLAGVLASSLYLEIPLRDAVSLSFFMNSKGIVEVITFTFFMTNKLIGKHTFSALVFTSVSMTAVSVPVAALLYDPARRYAVYKRRTVQHLKADADLRILACVHDESHVQGTLALLEASYATPQTPISLFLLQLVELAGRSAPVFIPHKPRSSAPQQPSTDSERVINAFFQYELRHPEGAVSVHPFTTISPYSSMHDEVCRLAVDKRTSLIVLHYHKRHMLAGGMRAAMGLRVVNRKVMQVAPCSVGVFVDRNAGSVQEELVGDMEKIVEVLRGLDKAGYDLVIVGMRHRWYPVMSANGLSDWSECPELGVIGDLLASSDFHTPYSVLIMKQQDQGGLNAAVPGAQDVWHGDDGGTAPPPERTMTTAGSSKFLQ
ncbi:cation/H(+) antiporter 15 [Brachypodium distachyon]|uniref:cation/H(+) antiporter 15 n=1 Tax=Brachypodium distachyon TaxID=15368 RepID=UPI000D0D6F8B|nr:cation/H(+) antiporter 15 [Brachypodium distachyon]|eukprot:XP_024315159.1 cation/H(+) antiporter 15 [Brachypodium distachyon]